MVVLILKYFVHIKILSKLFPKQFPEPVVEWILILVIECIFNNFVVNAFVELKFFGNKKIKKIISTIGDMMHFFGFSSGFQMFLLLNPKMHANTGSLR